MKRKVLILILIIAAILRFFQLGNVPASLSWDEASIGYNAFSIVKTLKDEHGNFLPFQYFAAFGDYKPPAAIYLTAISVGIFGLTDWAVRLPSALLGVATVLLTYLVAEKLRKRLGDGNLTSGFSLLAAFFLAISPWHTLLSRQMFEANIASFFILLGVYLFFLGIQKGKYLIPSFLFFVLSLYTFNSSRIFVPLFIAGLFWCFRRELLEKRKFCLTGMVLAFLLFLPLLPHLFSPVGQLRFKEVNIFSDSQVVLTANERIGADRSVWWSKIFNNRRVGFAKSFLVHYFDHFNADYLFFTGDYNPKFSTRANGQLFFVEVILLPLGIFFLASKEKKIFGLLVFWLLIGLIPAATARETPHALRTEVTLPVWQIFSAAGLFYLTVQRQKIIKVVTGMLILFLFLQGVYYLHDYYKHYSRDFSQDWQYGYKEAALYLKNSRQTYDHIWVSEVYGRPYIFFLNYLKYNPADFQREEKLRIDEFGFYHIDGFANFSFGEKEKKVLKGKTLLIGQEGNLGGQGKKLKDIYFLNGEKALELREM